MWQELLVALCLVFVIEGIIPFISPRHWRRYVISVIQMPDRQIRMAGLICMLVGTALLYLVH